MQVFDERGRRTAIVREEATPPLVTTEQRDAYLAERVANDRPHPGEAPIADRCGAYDQLLVSHEGEVWARHHEQPDDVHSRWTVYAPDLHSARAIVTPKMDVSAVRDGVIYGWTTDELDVQTVVALRATEMGG